MPRRCVLAGVLWVLAIVGGSCSDESAPSSQTTKSVLSARSIDAGSVEVTITPIRLDDQEALFTVSLDTHTVELSMNLVESAVLDVPSAIVPEESVCLLNSHHVDHAKISCKVVRAFDFDVLFRI